MFEPTNQTIIYLLMIATWTHTDSVIAVNVLAACCASLRSRGPKRHRVWKFFSELQSQRWQIAFVRHPRNPAPSGGVLLLEHGQMPQGLTFFRWTPELAVTNRLRPPSAKPSTALAACWLTIVNLSDFLLTAWYGTTNKLQCGTPNYKLVYNPS